ncbi:protein-L-isoaspartate(D-aspartate) O-methyltransferase [Natrialbaceae archaeon AArc-T1-2]|uniref:protein-L-isoaspartate(D-aspartate) O-methyltransferase n=1 Tax=Natrialbaceae archaeon AArc-T1-2 TaxID=3053904 RepID=UPI00255AE5B0|nr:protein-L-isoaspartate(D-aspartate) O-methyltransferase [Natrialbaceae archaeon AArc-T1-2]WIV66261.1 protein-L-isoaspartate(D-aspartate) O-methyltransferase [Natrialbaceae archaeon AArc-T1-2]
MSVDPTEARERLVEHVDPELEATEDALRAVPRHEFVPEAWRDASYADRPIPLGEGATISAPSIVAEMCDHLAPEPGDDVLEVGTGSGYHAAVTAEIVGPEHVYTIEYDRDLAERARKRFAELGYDEISVRVGDGRAGWPEHAPYDRIYLTCAVRAFPDPICEQIREGGLVLAPIGIAEQRLVLAKKTDGRLERLDCGPVSFVPIRGPDVSDHDDL